MASTDSELPANKKNLRYLSEHQIQMIDEALDSMSRTGFGCVRLVVENGVLRFVVKETSFDALKYEPGSLLDE